MVSRSYSVTLFRAKKYPPKAGKNQSCVKTGMGLGGERVVVLRQLIDNVRGTYQCPRYGFAEVTHSLQRYQISYNPLLNTTSMSILSMRVLKKFI